MGLAAGDALGTTLEFTHPGTFTPITDMVGGGPFDLKPGEWTDDTSMALCLAQSLIEKKGFDAVDQMERYCKWWKEGYLSSNGKCFDIGNATQDALWDFLSSREPYCGSSDPHTAGNGSLMRLAPIPLYYTGVYDNTGLPNVIKFAADSSKTTHAAATCVDSCIYFATLIWGALRGVSKEQLLSAKFANAELSHLHEEVMLVKNGSFRREPPEIGSSGYVITTLEAALWAFNKSKNFRDGALLSVNLGGDTDTIGAVYGQLAGAYYGEESIPLEWRDKLAHRELIESISDNI